jgi:hypothetical protein
MKIKLAMMVLLSGWAAVAVAQDKTADKPAEAPVASQCLIVAPRPIFKYEMRDSVNLSKDYIKDVYNGKDLTEIRKAGVRVIVIDPLGKQLAKAQDTCHGIQSAPSQPAGSPDATAPAPKP